MAGQISYSRAIQWAVNNRAGPEPKPQIPILPQILFFF